MAIEEVKNYVELNIGDLEEMIRSYLEEHVDSFEEGQEFEIELGWKGDVEELEDGFSTLDLRQSVVGAEDHSLPGELDTVFRVKWSS